MPYTIDTVHLLTRQPKYVKGNSYFLPLAGSIWINLFIELIIIGFVLANIQRGPNIGVSLLSSFSSLIDHDPLKWFNKASAK